MSHAWTVGHVDTSEGRLSAIKKPERRFKWPWVSRELLEYSEREREWLMAACKHANERHDELLQKYHALKLSGASIPEKQEKAVPKEPDVVTQAIIAKSKGDPRLRKHYADYVAEQRSAGVDEKDIADAILRGQDDNEGIPG